MEAKFFHEFQFSLINFSLYLAGENEAEQDGDCQLGVTEENDVEEIGVGWVLQEEPGQKQTLIIRKMQNARIWYNAHPKRLNMLEAAQCILMSS